MKKCILCDDELDEYNDSFEHIIPNFIGGRLQGKGILCKSCNSTQGFTTDKDFEDVFKIVSELLCIDKDRNHNHSIPCIVKFEENNIDCILKNFKITPIKPFFRTNGEKINVYCTKKVFKTYKKKVIKDLKCEEQDLVNIDNIGSMYSVNTSFENDSFAKGFTKIAVNFAIYNNITKENINYIENNDYDVGQVIPYLPLNDLENFYEKNKPKLNVLYPYHNLILFTNKNHSEEPKKLICLVELFSTYIYYVVLNNNYKGEDVYYSYFQTLHKRKEKLFSINSFPSMFDFVFKNPFDFFNYDHKLTGEIIRIQEDDLVKYFKTHFIDFNKKLLYFNGDYQKFSHEKTRSFCFEKYYQLSEKIGDERKFEFYSKKI